METRDELKERINTLYEEYSRRKRSGTQDPADEESLQHAVHLYAYGYPARISRQYRELCGDFWNFMSHKIIRYIENFVDVGLPFEHYLSVAVKYQFISFLRTTIRRDRENRMYAHPNAFFALDSSGAPTESAGEAPSGTSAEAPDAARLEDLILFLQRTMKNNETARRRLWWFVLYCSPMLPIERVKELGVSLGWSAEEVGRQLSALEGEISEQAERLTHMKEQCNVYFAKKHLVERRLCEDAVYGKEAEQCEEMRKVYGRRYAAAFAKLQRIPCTISHGRIGRLLGVPKGTIDSGISLLRKQCMNIRKKMQQQGGDDFDDPLKPKKPEK